VFEVWELTRRLSSTIEALPPDTDRLAAFGAWIAEHCDSASNVLEIGAGHGAHQFPGAIRERAGRLVGVDPDPRISQNPFLDEKHQGPLEEFAEDWRGRFECVYAYMVVEHVSDPAAFFQACRQVLAPGGHFFAATPNVRHYFAFAARATAAFGVQDHVLKFLVGGQAADSYHFRAHYRVNYPGKIARVLREAGFSQVEFKMLDNPSYFEWYLPKSLGVFPRMYSRCLYAMRKPEFMGTIMFHARC